MSISVHTGKHYFCFTFFPIFAPSNRQRAGGHRSTPYKTKNMEERILSELAVIKMYSLLGAKNVLNFDDVVLLTGLSKSHLYKLTCTCQIPHYKPTGKQIYFDRSEVEAWMRQNRVNTQMEADQQAMKYVTGKGVAL